MSVSETPHFCESERETLYSVLAARRDMRHFRRQPIDPIVFARIVSAIGYAPSVGLTQPWRFIRVTDGDLRARIGDIVDTEVHRTAANLGERANEFLRLKVEGVRECGEVLVVAIAPDDGSIFGRRTMPYEMSLCSVACAIQNMWLAARAENVGMGWVSFFDPDELSELMELPTGATPVAVLCLGHVESFYAAPLLETEDWREARPFNELVYENAWGERESNGHR